MIRRFDKSDQGKTNFGDNIHKTHVHKLINLEHCISIQFNIQSHAKVYKTQSISNFKPSVEVGTKKSTPAICQTLLILIIYFKLILNLFFHV